MPCKQQLPGCSVSTWGNFPKAHVGVQFLPGSLPGPFPEAGGAPELSGDLTRWAVRARGAASVDWGSPGNSPESRS